MTALLHAHPARLANERQALIDLAVQIAREHILWALSRGYRMTGLFTAIDVPPPAVKYRYRDELIREYACAWMRLADQEKRRAA